MQSHTLPPLAVLGAGSWGTALALYLARLGQSIRLWSFDKAHVETMIAERANNRYLPHITFPDSLLPVADLSEAIIDIQDILIAVPSVGFRDILMTLKPMLKPNMRVLWATKGLDLETGQLFHEVARDMLGEQHPLAIISGPSFAKEVAAGLPTAVVVASQHPVFAHELVQRFNSGIFRIYLSHDMTGVEVGGVVKNILAIATGISDGMGFGANARCAIITRGLAEMTRLGLALGAYAETFTGLTGLGDLVLTCTDNQSRNRRFGLALGQGFFPAEAERDIGQVVEGKRNAELVIALASKHFVDMPISKTVWEILRGHLTPQEAMRYLLSREPKKEQ